VIQRAEIKPIIRLVTDLPFFVRVNSILYAIILGVNDTYEILVNAILTNFKRR
jgi:hypothetical protein